MMSRSYVAVLVKAGAAAIRYVGLVDEHGDAVGSRQPVRFVVAGASLQLAEDVSFVIPPQTTVAGWRAFDREAGGMDFGGATLPTETYTGRGEYVLLADGTSIDHAAG